jgi:O-antigen/teichoic acid export membrane protein
MAQAHLLRSATRRGRGAAAGIRRPASLGRLGRQVATRLGWGVADQIVSSLTNAALSVYVVHALGAVQFGAFTLAYVTYAFVLNACRGLATDPLMVRVSGAAPPTWRRAVASCTGTATAVGVTASVFVLTAAFFLGGTPRQAFLALGLTLPGLMLQDSWRFSFFAAGRGSLAFLNDLIWAALLVPAIIYLRLSHHSNVFYLVLAWGAAAAVAAAFGPIEAGVLPKLLGAVGWVKEHSDLGPRYLAEGAASSASSQLRTYGIGIILGVGAVGYVGASGTVMGPMTIIFLGMNLVLIPEAARQLQRSRHNLVRFSMLVSVGLALCAFAWGVVALVVLRGGIGNAVFGEKTWVHAYPLVLPWTVAVIGQGLSTGPATGLHALGAARRSLNAMLATSAAYLVFAVGGAALAGAAGSVWGLAIWNCIGNVLWWWQFRAAIREGDEVKPARPPRFRRQPAAAVANPAGRHRRGELDGDLAIADSPDLAD